MSNWMIPEDNLDNLSEEQRDFVDNILSKIEKSCLMQGFDFKLLFSTVLHSIFNLKRKNLNLKIAILLPNKLQLSIVNAAFNELDVKDIEVIYYYDFIISQLVSNYDYIFVLEIRELTYNMVKHIQAKSKVSIFTDTHQSKINDINSYTKEPLISEEEIKRVINQFYSFNTIYNLRPLKILHSLISDISILSSKTNYTKTVVAPGLAKASSKEKEVEYILSKSKDAWYFGQTVAVVLPTQNDVIEFINLACKLNNVDTFKTNLKNNYIMELNQYLENNNIDVVYIGNKNSDQFINNIEKGKIILLSYKNIRFIEFDSIFLPFFSERLKIDLNVLIHVVESHKLSLTITYSNEMHEYIKKIKHDFNTIDIDKILNQSNNSFDDDFDF